MLKELNVIVWQLLASPIQCMSELSQWVSWLCTTARDDEVHTEIQRVWKKCTVVPDADAFMDQNMVCNRRAI